MDKSLGYARKKRRKFPFGPVKRVIKGYLPPVLAKKLGPLFFPPYTVFFSLSFQNPYCTPIKK